MKENVLILFAVSLMALTSCSKGEKVCCKPKQDETIFLSAKKADTIWQTSQVFLSTYEDSLSISSTNKNEYLHMRIKPAGVGKYPVTSQNGLFSITVGGDVTLAEYHATADPANYINIISYDLKRRLIEGEFNVKFIINTRYAGSAFAEKISFVNGRFRADLP